MNLSNSMGLSPSSFRRVLTAHGRSTTPGLFDYTVGSSSGPLKHNSEAKKGGEQSASTMEVSAKLEKASPEDKLARQAIIENQRAVKLINTPVSKVHESGSSSPVDTYSFYKRSFRVHGKQAWEYAMRDLGSIDTLINRYGYVEPTKRLDIPPDGVPLVGDGSNMPAADVSTLLNASVGLTGAGTALVKP